MKPHKKSLLTECNIENDVSIEVKDNHIIIAVAIYVPKRKGWEQAFKKMAENWDDELMMPDIFMDEKIPCWTWPNQQ